MTYKAMGIRGLNMDNQTLKQLLNESFNHNQDQWMQNQHSELLKKQLPEEK